MATEKEDQPDSEQPRDNKGRFTPKTETEKTVQTSATISDYPFINAFMAKQLGLSDNFADLQQQFSPEELYKHLKFVAMTKATTGSQSENSKLPPNQKVVPVQPQESTKPELPGTVIGKPDFTEENFNISVRMAPSELIKPKKKEE